MDKVFIENLKAARIAAKMTQADVAEKIGVAKSTYSQYESGKREPGIPRVKMIAKVLDVPAEVLIGKEEQNQELWLTAQDNALLLMFKELNEIGKRKVMEYVSDIYDRYRHV